MTDRDVQAILKGLSGTAAPRPGFKQELGDLLAAELEEDEPESGGAPDVRAILGLIPEPVAPRSGFKDELHASLLARLDPAGPAPASRRRPRIAQFVADHTRGGWWMQSAAALIALAVVASGFAWNSCLQTVGAPERTQVAAPAPPSESTDPADVRVVLPTDSSDPQGDGQAGPEPNPAPEAPAGGSAPAPDEPRPDPGPREDPPEGEPAPPPAAAQPERLAFASKTGDGYWHIFTMNEDGTGRVQLTHGEAHDRGPAWSPDGRRIAFMRLESANDHDGQIFVMKADGSGLRYLADGGEPAWSPDGRRIVYWASTPPDSIWIINADGSGARALPVSGILGDPYWSPDGDLISFAGAMVAQSPDPLLGSTQVYTIHPDGTGARRLTSETWACNMSFSPDGERIVYTTSDDFITTHIWTMNADGSQKKQLTEGSGMHAFPHWSPDGKRIVFSHDPDGEPHWSFIDETVGPQPGVIWVMRVDGSHVRRISPSGVDDADPVFRPESRRKTARSSDR